MTRVKSPTRRTALGLIGAAVTVPRAALARDIETIGGTAFGTSWQLSGPYGGDVAELHRPIDAMFAKIDAQFSPWRPDSKISKFNAAPLQANATDQGLIDVTAAALDIARHSEGAFDPTVGPLVAQWGFGPIHRGSGPDWRGIAVGSQGVSKSRDDLTLDLCGIAKGWALDQAASLAQSNGVRSFLFELGGEYIAVGHHPSGRNWRIAVQSPLSGHAASTVLRLPDGAAVATSGTRTQSYQLDKHLYSHIINPKSNTPAAGKLRSVTVIAEDAMQADGWATALFAAGDKAGPDIATTQGIPALFIFQNDSTLTQVWTAPFTEFAL